MALRGLTCTVSLFEFRHIDLSLSSSPPLLFVGTIIIEEERVARIAGYQKLRFEAEKCSRHVFSKTEVY